MMTTSILSLREDPVQKLTNCPVRFHKSVPMIHCPGQVRMRERNPAKGTIAKRVARGRLSI